MPTPQDLISVVVGPTARQAWGAPAKPRAAVVGPGVRSVVDVAHLGAVAAELEAGHPRWVWWAAASAARHLIEHGVRPARAWDIAEAHRLRCGGWAVTPGVAWAAATGLDPTDVPAAPSGDLFDAATGADDDGQVIRPDGHLRPDAVAGTWQNDDERLLAWADVTLQCAHAQRERARERPRLLQTSYAESAAAVLCEELAHDGLPVDRAALLELVGPMSGPRGPRDAQVLRHVPGRDNTDLRNPVQVKELLRAVGIDVATTRKHVLDAFRDVHPVVPALLQWRKEERIATTYGLRWIADHIGADDRLRGGWRAGDGASGRMTAENGLHNLPVMLRPGVAANAGHVFVRADLGQIEPRVLAVVSGDPVFAQACREDDLYAPVARRLGVERAVAKMSVLGAMYGGRAGITGEALKGLERSYPVAMGLLDRAYLAGCRGEDVTTYGGRLIRTGRFLDTAPIGADPEVDAARGRFARNAIIQGAAAELFKAWAATLRAAIRGLDAEIVLCLHDELLVHVRDEDAAQVAAAVESCLDDAARRWSGGAPVRFLADTCVVHRWSEAKE